MCDLFYCVLVGLIIKFGSSTHRVMWFAQRNYDDRTDMMYPIHTEWRTLKRTDFFEMPNEKSFIHFVLSYIPENMEISMSLCVISFLFAHLHTGYQTVCHFKCQKRQMCLFDGVSVTLICQMYKNHLLPRLRFFFSAFASGIRSINQSTRIHCDGS